MASPYDDLLTAEGPAGDSARSLAEQDTQVQAGETYADTSKRTEYEAAAQARIQVRKGKELASRGLVPYTDAQGGVSAVTDKGGAALTKYDPKNQIAYDSTGNPQKVEFDQFGNPQTSDPFAGLTPTLDEKTGEKYLIAPGLPWRHAGTDQQVKKKVEFAKEDKMLGEVSSHLGRKLNIAEKQLNIIEDKKKSAAQRLAAMGIGIESEDGSLPNGEQLAAKINTYFDSEMQSGTATKKGFFGLGGETDEAKAEQQQIGQKRAAALAIAGEYAKQFNDSRAIQQEQDATLQRRTQIEDARLGREEELMRDQGLGGLLGDKQQTEQPAAGLVKAGNIDLNNRPIVKNEDGTISTVRSIGVEVGGKEVLIPTVSDDGRVMSNEEAVKTFKQTGKHLGVFDTPENANAYAEKLHKEQDVQYTAKAAEQSKQDTQRGMAAMDAVKKLPPLDIGDKMSDIGSNPQQLVPFLSGASEIKHLVQVKLAANRLEKALNANTDPSAEDLTLVKAFTEHSQRDTTFGYKFMSVLAALPAFAGELAATGGIYTAAQKATLKLGTKALEKFGSEAGAKLLAQLTERVIEKSAGLAVKGTIAKTAGMKAVEFGARSASAIAGSLAQTIPAAGLNIAAETVSRMIPNISFSEDDKGKINYLLENTGDDFSSALQKSFKSQFTEVASEKTGGMLAFIPGADKLKLLKLGVMRRWFGINPTASPSGFAKMVQRAGWHGVIGEIFEERVGDVMKAGLGLQEWKDVIPTWEQFFVEAAAFGVPSAAGTAYGAYRNKKYQATVKDMATDYQAREHAIGQVEPPAGAEPDPTSDVISNAMQGKNAQTASFLVGQHPESAKQTSRIIAETIPMDVEDRKDATEFMSTAGPHTFIAQHIGNQMVSQGVMTEAANEIDSTLEDGGVEQPERRAAIVNNAIGSTAMAMTVRQVTSGAPITNRLAYETMKEAGIFTEETDASGAVTRSLDARAASLLPTSIAERIKNNFSSLKVSNTQDRTPLTAHKAAIQEGRMLVNRMAQRLSAWEAPAARDIDLPDLPDDEVTPPANPLDAEHANVANLVQGVMTKHAGRLKVLGLPDKATDEKGTRKGKSGLRNFGGIIHLDAEALYESTKNLTPEERAAFIEKATEEEIDHAETVAWAYDRTVTPEERKKRQAKVKKLLKTEAGIAKGLQDAREDWGTLTDEEKAHEVWRAIMQMARDPKGRTPLTESTWKMIEEFVEWLRGRVANLSTNAKDLMGELESWLAEHKAELEKGNGKGELTPESAADAARSALAASVEIGRGGNAVVYDVPDTDFVLRVEKTSDRAIKGPFTLVDDRFAGRNFGQALAVHNGMQLLRKQSGVPAGLDPLVKKDRNTTEGQKANDENYAASINRAANMPQSAYDNLAETLLSLKDIGGKGAQFDPSKSNNILIDVKTGEFNIVDVNESPAKYVSSVNDLLVPLMDTANSHNYKGVSLQSAYQQIFDKAMEAARKAGMSMKLDSGGEYAAELAGRANTDKADAEKAEKEKAEKEKADSEKAEQEKAEKEKAEKEKAEKDKPKPPKDEEQKPPEDDVVPPKDEEKDKPKPPEAGGKRKVEGAKDWENAGIDLFAAAPTKISLAAAKPERKFGTNVGELIIAAQAGTLDLKNPEVLAKLNGIAEGILSEADENPSVKTPEGFTARFLAFLKKFGKEDSLTGRVVHIVWGQASISDETLPDASRTEFETILEDLRNPKEKTYRWITPDMEKEGWKEKFINTGLIPQHQITTPEGMVFTAVEDEAHPGFGGYNFLVIDKNFAPEKEADLEDGSTAWVRDGNKYAFKQIESARKYANQKEAEKPPREHSKYEPQPPTAEGYFPTTQSNDESYPNDFPGKAESPKLANVKAAEDLIAQVKLEFGPLWSRVGITVAEGDKDAKALAYVKGNGFKEIFVVTPKLLYALMESAHPTALARNIMYHETIHAMFNKVIFMEVRAMSPSQRESLAKKLEIELSAGTDEDQQQELYLAYHARILNDLGKEIHHLHPREAKLADELYQSGRGNLLGAGNLAHEVFRQAIQNRVFGRFDEAWHTGLFTTQISSILTRVLAWIKRIFTGKELRKSPLFENYVGRVERVLLKNGYDRIITTPEDYSEAIKERLLAGIQIKTPELQLMGAGLNMNRTELLYWAQRGVFRAAQIISQHPILPSELIVDRLSQLDKDSPEITQDASRETNLKPVVAYFVSRLSNAAGEKIQCAIVSDDLMPHLERDNREQLTHAYTEDLGQKELLESIGVTSAPSMNSLEENQIKHTHKSLIYSANETAIADTEPEQTVKIGSVEFKSRNMNFINALNLLDEQLHSAGSAVLVLPSVEGTTPEERLAAYQSEDWKNFSSILYRNYGVASHVTVSDALLNADSPPLDIIHIKRKTGSASIRTPHKEAPPIISTVAELRQKLYDHEHPTTKAPKAGGNARGTRNDRDEPPKPPTRGNPADGDGGRDNGDDNSGGSDGSPPKEGGGASGGGSESGGKRGGISVDLGGRTHESGLDVETLVQPDEGDDFQSLYRGESTVNPGKTLTPKNLVQKQKNVLEQVKEEVGDIDEFVIKELGYKDRAELGKRLMSEQVDAVALSIWNHRRGIATINGDQTGIGKGRVLAALMKWCLRNDLTPIFMTEKPNLFMDMLRDANNIGAFFEGDTDRIEPFIIANDVKLSTEIEGKTLTYNTPNDQVKNKVWGIAKDGQLPKGYNAIFVNYSQIDQETLPPEHYEFPDPNTPVTLLSAEDRAIRQATIRTQALRALAPKAMLLMDESHFAAGESASETEEGKRVDKMLGIMDKMSGVYYSSATYAKRASSIPLYYRTAISRSGIEAKKIGEIMHVGGAPLQQEVASMLAESSMFRRERSMRGVSFGIKQTEQYRERDREIGNQFSDMVQEVGRYQNNIKENLSKLEAAMQERKMCQQVDSAGKAMGRKVKLSSYNFSSSFFNVIETLLFSMKADAVADDAIERVKNGNKKNPLTEEQLHLMNQIESAAMKRGGDPLKERFSKYGTTEPFHTQDIPEGDMNLLYASMTKPEEMEYRTHRDSQRPQKVVIAINQTGEATLKALKEMGLDKTYNSALERFMNKIAEGIAVKWEGGSTKKNLLGPNAASSLWDTLPNLHDENVSDMPEYKKLLSDARADYEKLVGLVRSNEELKKLPVSPIDHITDRLKKAGIEFGEYTSRSNQLKEGVIIDRPDDESSPKNRGRMNKKFNNEDLDVMIINASGAVGISLHSSRDDSINLKQRVMFIMSPITEINGFQQIIGRIMRTGMVQRPEYLLIQTTLPHETRKASFLRAKLSKLNASTTSNKDTAMTGSVELPDFFNQIGDDVALETLLEHPQVLAEMPLKFAPNLPQAAKVALLNAYYKATSTWEGGFVRSFSGWMSTVSPDTMDAFWNDFGERFKGRLRGLIENGEDPFATNERDFQAELIAANTIFDEVDADVSFGQKAVIEKLKVKEGGEPMSTDDAYEEANKNARRWLEKPKEKYSGTKPLDPNERRRRDEENLRQDRRTEVDKILDEWEVKKSDEIKVAQDSARARFEKKWKAVLGKREERDKQIRNGKPNELQQLLGQTIKEKTEAEYKEEIDALNKEEETEHERDLAHALVVAERGVARPYEKARENIITALNIVAAPRHANTFQVGIGAGEDAERVLAICTDILLRPDSPTSSADHLLIFRVNDGRNKGMVKVPLSQLASIIRWQPNSPQFGGNYDFQSDWDKTMRRERIRYVVTGNAIGGYKALLDRKVKGKMSFITFTRNDGEISKGILLPANFTGFTERKITTGSEMRQALEIRRATLALAEAQGSMVFDPYRRTVKISVSAKATNAAAQSIINDGALLTHLINTSGNRTWNVSPRKPATATFHITNAISVFDALARLKNTVNEPTAPGADLTSYPSQDTDPDDDGPDGGGGGRSPNLNAATPNKQAGPAADASRKDVTTAMIVRLKKLFDMSEGEPTQTSGAWFSAEITDEHGQITARGLTVKIPNEKLQGDVTEADAEITGDFKSESSVPPQSKATRATGVANGAEAQGHYDLIEADDLKKLIQREVGDAQNRDRTTNEASKRQVEMIRQKPDPSMLTENSVSLTGAPSIDDEAILAGNGRADGVTQAWDTNPTGIKPYRESLEESAKRLGLQSKLAGMKQPVLVFRVTGYKNGTRRDFIIESNPKSIGLNENTVEEALNDYEALAATSNIVEFTEGGDLTAQSLQMVASVMEKQRRPLKEDSKGKFNLADGTRRVQAAMLAGMARKAGLKYGELAQVMESENGKRAISTILARAGRLAALDSDLSLANPIMAALAAFQRGIAAVKGEQYKSLEEWFSNRKMELIRDDLSNDGEILLALFSRSQRSAKELATILDAYLVAAKEEQNQRDLDKETGDMFGNERAKVSPFTILSKITNAESSENPELFTEGSSGKPENPTPAAKDKVEPPAEEKPEPAKEEEKQTPLKEQPEDTDGSIPEEPDFGADTEEGMIGRRPIKVSDKPTPDYKGQPVGTREAQKSLEAIGSAVGKTVPFQVGRVKGKQSGTFKEHPEVVRMRTALSLDVAAHETGHLLAKVLYKTLRIGSKKGVVPNNVLRELKKLGEDLYGGAKPIGSYTSEGFAEFWRLYFTTDTAEIEAPNAFKYFTETVLPAFAEVESAVKQAREAFTQYRAQGVRNKASADVVDPNSSANKLKRFKQSMSRPELIRKWVDELEPIRQMVAEAEEKIGASLPIDKNPYAIGSALRGTAKMIASYMNEKAMRDFAGNVTGQGLSEIMAIVKGKESDFMLFLWAHHALERWDANKNPGLTRSEAQFLVDELGKDPNFNIAADKYWNWNRGLMNYVREASPSIAPLIDSITSRWKKYIPLSRWFEPGEVRTAIQSAQTGASTALKSITRFGSGREILEPMPVILNNAEKWIELAHKRVILDAVMELRKVEGLGFQIEEVPRGLKMNSLTVGDIRDQLEKMGMDTSTVEDDDILNYFTPMSKPQGKDPIISHSVEVTNPETGKKELKTKWFFVEPRIFDALEGIDLYRLPKALNLLLGFPARMFRLGTTGLRASFSFFTNPARDLPTLLMQSDSKASALTLFGSWIRSFGSLWNPNRLRGQNHPLIDMFDRLGMQVGQPLGQDIDPYKQHQSKSLSGRMVHRAHNAIETLQKIFSISESAPRIAEMEQVAKDVGWDWKAGAPITTKQMYAIMLATKRSTVDFSAAGSYAKVVNQAIPFFNATIQGARSFGRAFHKNPLKTVLRGLTALTIPALLLWWKYKDDEWFKDMTWREKYLYFNIPVGDQLIQIPRPQEWGNFFSAVPEAILDSLYRKDPEAAAQVMKHVFVTLNPVDLPPVFNTIKEQLENRVAFFDRPIVPKSLLNAPAGEQRGRHDTALADTLGDIFPNTISPLRVDAAIRSMTGGVIGDFSRDAQTIGHVIGLGNTEKQPSASDIPVLGKMFRRGGTDSSLSLSVNNFYAELDKANRRKESITQPEMQNDRKRRLMLEDAQKAIKILTIARASAKTPEAERKLNHKIREIAQTAIRIAPKPTDNKPKTYEEAKRNPAPKATGEVLRPQPFKQFNREFTSFY